ncbi:MAG: TerB N-terminal domain-containing protein [Cyanobacteria bacterium P01_D01_bin.1]
MLNFLKKIVESLSPDTASGQNKSGQPSNYSQQYYQQPSYQQPTPVKERQKRNDVVANKRQTASGVKAKWIKPGTSVSVAGFDIPGGMVYVGTQLPTVGPYKQIDPCLINPKLRVDKTRSDYAGQELGYWPAYDDISPGSRAAYLEWLMGDRKDPNACIGYVFLFFYGLERRVLIDLSETTDCSAELTHIISEVERLLALYPDSHSFQGYAAQFLDVCKLVRNPDSFAESSPVLERTGWQMPLSTQVALGKIVAAGKPIPVDWLLSWYFHSETTRLRTPAIRCATEFQKLLRLKYAEKYGEGMVLKPNKRRLKVEYRPASSGFSHSAVGLEVGDLPDVSALTAPLSKLQLLVDDCTDALDPYSRWLGRNADKFDAKAAIALLPIELIEDFENDEIRLLRQWLKQTLADQSHQTISGKQILAWWSTAGAEKLTKKESTTLAQSFEKLGYGIEPDVRFGGKVLKQESQFILFQLPKEKIGTPSKAYSAAKILMHLAAAIANADNVVDASEQQHLEAHLETTLALSEAERVRLRAHLAWLLQEKLSLRGLKTKLSEMTSDEKAGIANFLISVAGADGHISPKEITMLSKIYPLLGFEADDIYSHIHNFSTSSSSDYSPVKSTAKPATEPVTVRTASSVNRGFTIPAPTADDRDKKEVTAAGFALDLTAVKRKQDESANVSVLLSNIFEEEEDDSIELKPEEQTPAEPEDSISGLDGLHTKFLRILAQQPSWSRDALESKAAELNLLLDGALEVINDTAFDVCDEPLTEGEDLIELDSDVLEQLLP